MGKKKAMRAGVETRHSQIGFGLFVARQAGVEQGEIEQLAASIIARAAGSHEWSEIPEATKQWFGCVASGCVGPVVDYPQGAPDIDALEERFVDEVHALHAMAPQEPTPQALQAEYRRRLALLYDGSGSADAHEIWESQLRVLRMSGVMPPRREH